VNESFVAGFRAVMLISSGFAIASALAAAMLVSDQRTRFASRDPRRSDLRRVRTAGVRTT
jgi:hypothetical protein